MADKLVPFDVAELQNFTNACIKARVKYGWGSKIAHGAVPGKDFTACDCSGYVDEAVWRATGGELDLPAGSWAEEEAVKKAGFETCPVSDGNKHDGVVRLAFYPGVGKNPVRHVVILLNGQTYESHGNHGVDNRPWNTAVGWMAACKLYVIARPTPTPEPKPASVLGHDVPCVIVRDSAYLGLKALQSEGVLTVVALGPGYAKIHERNHGTSVLPLEILGGVGYVPARLLASLLDSAVSWDNQTKKVTIA